MPTADTIDLDERMTAADLARHVEALRRDMGGNAEVYLQVASRTEPASVGIYPHGLAAWQNAQHFYTATWPAAFAAAATWVRTRRAEAA
jgi:hypothetical protein